tara:strand:- start:53 stop:169 length:117 start_codon:yes stop_codon:yes gene_type:complete
MNTKVITMNEVREMIEIQIFGSLFLIALMIKLLGEVIA